MTDISVTDAVKAMFDPLDEVERCEFLTACIDLFSVSDIWDCLSPDQQAELAALQSAQQWRGIESAPDDDTFLVRKGSRVAIAFRDTGMSSYRFFCPIRRADLPFSPDEWCPLPAAAIPETGADQ